MPTIREALAQAVALHQAGNLPQAEQIYRQVLQADSRNADAWHLLGVVYSQVNRHDAAVEHIRRAIALNPGQAVFHANLGAALQKLKRVDESLACFRRALELNPSYAEAHNNLGVALQSQGDPAAAVECFRRALKQNPNYAEAHCNLGSALQAVGRLAEALACQETAVRLRPNYAEAHHGLGTALASLGRLDEAIAAYRRALQLKENAPETHNNLGVVLKKQNKLEEAVAAYRRALALQPDYAEALTNLGNALHEQGHLDEAIACHQRALQLKPDYAEVLNNLGNALREKAQLPQAIACFQRAEAIAPELAETPHSLGVVLKEQGKIDEAIVCYRRALDLDPNYADAHNSLGLGMQQQGRAADAIACYQRALELKPDLADAHNNLGNAFRQAGQLAAAVARFQRALQLQPDMHEAHNNLGIAYQDLGRNEEALASYRRALEIKPDHADAHSNLGNVLRDAGQITAAIAHYQRAVQLKPDLHEAHNNLGNAYKDQGRLDEALACFRRAFEIKPDYVDAHSNWLFSLQYRPGITPAELAAAHAEFDRRQAALFRAYWPSQASPRKVAGPLRLGFVSPDFSLHPVGFFLIRALENLDRGAAEIVCYNDRLIKDRLTARFQAVATDWRDVFGRTDEQLAAQIRDDRIDVLFDLAGHTAHNRMLLFARRPAPLQVTWIGYEGSTGLSAIDYLLADRHMVPEEAEAFCAEKVLRLPECYLCYDPPDEAPPVGPLPAAQAGYVTFASCNNLAKVNAEVVAAWAEILRRVAGAKLLLKYRGLEDAATREHFAGLFAAHGISADRLIMEGWSTLAELFAAHNRIDIALDPFPFCGGVTTCNALWMGVPVITWPGETFAGRHSLSYLQNVGLTETIAGSREEYINIAAGLAGILPRLADLRAGLRQRMDGSPLCDGKRFAGNWMSLIARVTGG